MSRRLMLFGIAASLAACQTTKQHSLTEADLKTLRFSQFDVGFAPDATVIDPLGAMRWARGKLPPPEGGMTYDPANPNAQDPRMIEYGEKLQELAKTPQATQAARAELVDKLKAEVATQLSAQSGGTRDVRVMLTIRSASVQGNQNDIVFEASLFDKKTGQPLTAPQSFQGTYTEARGGVGNSVAGMVVSFAVAAAINAYRGDPIVYMMRDGVTRFKTWLMQPAGG